MCTVLGWSKQKDVHVQSPLGLHHLVGYLWAGILLRAGSGHLRSLLQKTGNILWDFSVNKVFVGVFFVAVWGAHPRWAGGFVLWNPISFCGQFGSSLAVQDSSKPAFPSYAKIGRWWECYWKIPSDVVAV